MSLPEVPLRKIDHLKFYVGNAKQAAYFYRHAFGFDVAAYSGLETKNKSEASYVLQQGGITFILSTPLTPDHPHQERLKTHGDGVMDVAFSVDDVKVAHSAAVARGAKSYSEPRVLKDDHGEYHHAAIRTFGDTVHSFVNADNYKGVFAPGFEKLAPDRYGSGKNGQSKSTGLLAIDHVVGNVELGKMNEWVEFYKKVLGFDLLMTFDDKDISTEYSALMSKVIQGGRGRIKIPINEPAKAKRRSQIDEYLDFYHGPGVQHIAMATNDIIHTVSKLRDNDVSFLRVPRTYYDELTNRVGKIKEDINTLADLGILVDRDDEGYMLQIFTKPVEDRPTLFFEIIQREGSKSFGKGNFKALFESIEREQALRGTL